MTDTNGYAAPSGDLALTVIRTGDIEREFPAVWPGHELSLAEIIEHGLPQAGIPGATNRWRRSNARHLWRGARRVLWARIGQVPTHYGTLWLSVIRADGRVEDLGLASMRVVTTAGVNKIVAVMNGADAATGIAFKFHGLGTGSTAEAAADTALVTELTTQYNPDNTRATGTQTTGGSSNVYRTVGTNTVDATAAIQEHGIFSAATAGTLLDRSVFSTVTLASGDSLQATYDLTIAAGS